MKYADYQVWFHAFNNAISAFGRREDITLDLGIEKAEKVADKALEKFKNVQMPEAPAGLEGLDLQGLVDRVAKSATKGK